MGKDLNPENAARFPLRAAGWLLTHCDETKAKSAWKLALSDIKCDLDVDSNNDGNILLGTYVHNNFIYKILQKIIYFIIHLN